MGGFSKIMHGPYSMVRTKCDIEFITGNEGYDAKNLTLKSLNMTFNDCTSMQLIDYEN